MDSQKDEPTKKRVRKSGLVYRSYLTSREPLDNAPTSFKKVVTNNSVDDSDFGGVDQDINAFDIEVEYPNTEVEQPDPNHGAQDFSENEEHSNTSDFSESDSDASEYLTDESNSSSSENESDYNAEYEDTLKDMPIYEGARLNTGASMLLIMTFILEHNLSGDAFSDLLDLISLHCKPENTIPTSKHLFNKWFHDLKITPKKHAYCSNCLITLDNPLAEECQNKKCNNTFRNKSDKSFFVEVPLVKQIKKLMYDNIFREQLTFRFKREKKKEENIEDIFDGKYYKQFNILSNQNNISFLWNTDGIPLFKSSKMSMWPLYYVINELPYKIRREPRNMLLVGLWIGPKKPEMMTFLQPFVGDLKLMENGIQVETDENKSIEVKGILIAGTSDLPAKCAVCNIMQYNGKYSCPSCTQPGQSAVAGNGRCQIFPFSFENPVGPERTHNESIQMAEMATETGKPVYGIKGPCWFTSLDSYNFVTGNCIDYMHCVLLGITKLLISLWFLKQSAGEKFSVSGQLPIVEKRLKNIKPPIYINRKPRSISDIKYWKASELRSWLLFYAPVVLIGILNKEYYEHFLLFSNAVFLMLQDSISETEVSIAENFLEHFVSRFPELYQERYTTLNMHLLLHIPDNVRNLGPLWAFSCFPFEDANGYLLKLVKGTQSVESQILNSMSVSHGLPFLQETCIIPGSKEAELYQKLSNPQSKNMTRINDNLYILGKYHDNFRISEDCYAALSTFFNVPFNGKIRTFKRIKKNNKIFHSLEYTRVRVRNSYTVKYVSKFGTISYGMIKYFTQCQHLQGQYILGEFEVYDQVHTLAIVIPLTRNHAQEFQFPHDDVTDQQLMEHIAICNTPNYESYSVAIPVKDIIDLCVMINGANVCYLTTVPNNLEKD